MPKSLGSWSAIRKDLEQEMLCESLHGRIRYDCTTYPNMDGCCIFRIYFDDQELKRFSHETVNSYFIKRGLKEKPANLNGKMGYWIGYWKLLDETPIAERTEYTDEEFCEALGLYRNQDIFISLHSKNPIVLMFALLDRRVGKRTIQKLEKDMVALPGWVQDIYKIRVS